MVSFRLSKMLIKEIKKCSEETQYSMVDIVSTALDLFCQREKRKVR